MPTAKRLTHEEVLQELHKDIDMPKDIHEVIVAKYKSIGNWLDRDESEIKFYKPFVAPQGSVLLGTANRPIGKNEDYDVDLICRLFAQKWKVTQKILKQMVGHEVKAYAKAQNMIHVPEDKQRCWTLQYADDHRFHVDVLPCLPDAKRYRQLLIKNKHHSLTENASIVENAVAITDKTDPNYAHLTEDWPTSNPLGFAAWFFDRMAERLLAEKRELMQSVSIYARVEDVPNHRVKTTLQKTIQLLKRHRDTMFADDPDVKPISIIITTLSACAYGNEAALADALAAILQNMESFIEDRQGVAWIANPVNPEENFADKWVEDPKKKKAFEKWLTAVRRDFGAYLNGTRPEDVPPILRERLGESMVDRVMRKVRPVNQTAPAILAGAAMSRAEEIAAQVRERGTSTKPWHEIDN